MSVRKCIYTGKDSDAKDKVLPDNPFNWANGVPTTKEYKNTKTSTLPTELEMQANETFHLLELARNRVLYYEAKLAEIQGNIQGKPDKVEKSVDLPIKKVTKSVKKPLKKDLEIKQAIKEKDLIEESEKMVEKTLKKKSNLWD